MHSTSIEISSLCLKIFDETTKEFVGFGVLSQEQSYISDRFFSELEKDAILKRERVELTIDQCLVFEDFTGHHFVQAVLSETDFTELDHFFSRGKDVVAHQLNRPVEFGSGSAGVQFIFSDYSRGGSKNGSPLAYVSFGSSCADNRS